MSDGLLGGHDVRSTVSTIRVDTVDDELSLHLIQKLGLIREVHDEQQTGNTEGDGDDSEQEEDPSPCVEHTSGFDFGKTVANDLRETGNSH